MSENSTKTRPKNETMPSPRSLILRNLSLRFPPPAVNRDHWDLFVGKCSKKRRGRKYPYFVSRSARVHAKSKADRMIATEHVLFWGAIHCHSLGFWDSFDPQVLTHILLQRCYKSDIEMESGERIGPTIKYLFEMCMETLHSRGYLHKNEDLFSFKLFFIKLITELVPS